MNKVHVKNHERKQKTKAFLESMPVEKCASYNPINKISYKELASCTDDDVLDWAEADIDHFSSTGQSSFLSEIRSLNPGETLYSIGVKHGEMERADKIFRKNGFEVKSDLTYKESYIKYKKGKDIVMLFDNYF